MKQVFCKMIKKEYELKDGTKTSWILKEENTSELDYTQYKNIIESSPFFRRLGGSETHTKNYTRAGYLTTRLTSKNPARNVKVVREFVF